MTNISDLPDEVLEFILCFVSPYQDLHACMAVSKRWRKCVQTVVRIRRRNFNSCISDFNVKWINSTPSDTYPTISKRYSHAALIDKNFMYVFGGCTSSMTTFNDLWKFDLSKREWRRPLATGSYPSPKACSSLVFYDDMLVLFGGWTYPPSYPLYQSWHLFNELHVYDIKKNHWRSICTLYAPPPMAGHSVSVIDKWMIVFGGLAKLDNVIECQKTNDVWKLNLLDWTWVKQEVEGRDKPTGRFGQTQVILDSKNILIIGGSGGSNANYSDAWILNMENENSWKWISVEIRGRKNKPSNIWSHPGCKVDDKIIVLNRMEADSIFPIASLRYPPFARRERPLYLSARIDLADREPDLDENINGRRGSLRMNQRDLLNFEIPRPSNEMNQPNSIPGTSRNRMFSASDDAFNESYQRILNSDPNLEELHRAHRLAQIKAEQKKKANRSTHLLGLYVLDLTHALDARPYVTWLSPKNHSAGPEESILYTLVQGKSELIMFGGIQNDNKTLGRINNPISNSLHFMLAKDRII